MLTDESLMPFGIHEGKKMIDVPAAYLLWLYGENKCNEAVKFYVEDNKEVLIKEMKENKYQNNEND